LIRSCRAFLPAQQRLVQRDRRMAPWRIAFN